MTSKRVCLRLLSLSCSSARLVQQSQPWRMANATSTLHRTGPSFTKMLQASDQRRWHSNPVSKSKVYSFDEIKSLIEKPPVDHVLIDVREPSEYTAGFIPTAINLPIKSQPDALFLPAEEFEDRFGFPKPAADKEVVFYCRSGVRSSAAARLAEQVGYQKIGEYRGSWLDWEEKGGQKSG